MDRQDVVVGLFDYACLRLATLGKEFLVKQYRSVFRDQSDAREIWIGGRFMAYDGDRDFIVVKHPAIRSFTELNSQEEVEAWITLL